MGTGGNYNPQGAVLGQKTVTARFYTFVASDAGKYLTFTNASSQWATIPPDVFPVDTVITLEQGGAGELVIAQGAGVTVNSYDGEMAQGQYAVMQIIQKSANVWTCIGGLEASVTTTTTTVAATTTTTAAATTTTT